MDNRVKKNAGVYGGEGGWEAMTAPPLTVQSVEINFDLSLYQTQLYSLNHTHTQPHNHNQNPHHHPPPTTATHHTHTAAFIICHFLIFPTQYSLHTLLIHTLKHRLKTQETSSNICT